MGPTPDWVMQFGQYGLAGLVIVGLGFTVRALFLKYAEVQELRIKEGREVVDVLNRSATALDRNTQSIIELSRKRGH